MHSAAPEPCPLRAYRVRAGNDQIKEHKPNVLIRERPLVDKERKQISSIRGPALDPTVEAALNPAPFADDLGHETAQSWQQLIDHLRVAWRQRGGERDDQAKVVMLG